jgi:hypothetical protein
MQRRVSNKMAHNQALMIINPRWPDLSLKVKPPAEKALNSPRRKRSAKSVTSTPISNPF